MSFKSLPGISTQCFVVHGAKLSCSFGTANADLKIPISHGVLIHGRKQANISDFKSMINITSFCSCMITSPPPPCIPAVTMHWIGGKSDVIIGDSPALLNTSIAICARGGMIRIVDDGQET